jgi:serine-type D-Ala-D-Ala carboxypeptidase (penicillin-binding protein 5/6)
VATVSARRRRGRRRLAVALLALLVVAAAVVEIVRRGDTPAPAPAPTTAPGPLQSSTVAPRAGSGTAPSPLAVRLAEGNDPVQLRFKHPPRSGLLFDIDTGRVLWRRLPTRVLPIASLTKMMTALVVNDKVSRRGYVKVTKQALAYQGSGVGVLPKGKWIKVESMLYGLLLPSGNDAAIALAQRASGTVPRFVGAMNARAQAMGLVCTHYTSPATTRAPATWRRRRGRSCASRGWPGSSGPGRSSCRSRSRGTSSTCTTTTRCCGWAIPAPRG